MDFNKLFHVIYREINIYYLQPNIFVNFKEIKKACKNWNLFWTFDKIIRLNINNDLINTNKIFDLKNLDNIKYLNFNKNNLVINLTFCKNLLYLYCENTNIVEIPEELNCLEELYCSYCYNLLKIPEIETTYFCRERQK